MSNLGVGWIHPTSIDPALFANREAERRQIEDILEDLFRNGTCRYRVAIYGDRGIGKSILTSVAIRNFAERHPNRVLRVEINGRGIAFRQSLKALAGDLVKGMTPMLPALGDKEPAFTRWLKELGLLAHNDQITEGQVEELKTEYGVGAKMGGGLFGVLQGESSFSWDQSRQRSTSSIRVQTVTDDLLHSALKATLRKIQDETSLMVVVFFDDLDQAYTDDVQAMKPALKRILDVDPCVGFVHVRTEMLFDDLRREMDDSIEVGALDEHGLMSIMLRRLERAIDVDQQGFRRAAVQTAMRKLTRATGNPLAFLRWVHAFARTRHWPPGSDESWCTDQALLQVVTRASTSAGIEDELLVRLATIADRCLSSDGRKIQKYDLLRGRRKDGEDDGKTITEDEFELFVRTGMLVPLDRFREAAGYRLDPTLDLLRPSVAARLREP